MKKYSFIILVLLISVVVTSCVNFKTIYFSYKLTSAEKQTGDRIEIVDITENGVYEDEFVKVVFLINTETEFQLELLNKTKKSMSISWEDASFIHYNNNSVRIVYLDKYGDFSRYTVIPKESKIDGVIHPSDRKYHSFNKIIDEYCYSEEKYSIIKEKYKGKKVQVLIPIVIENTKFEYYFIFDINTKFE